MKRGLFSLVLFLISSPGIQVLWATQEAIYQGRPVPITPMGPTRPGPRTSFWIGTNIVDQFRVVVRDHDAWLDVWKRIHTREPRLGVPYPAPPLPEIDFSREMVVVAAMGQRPTTGYAIIIDGAYERDDRLEVVVKSVINLKCYAGYSIVTSPIDIVRLPKIERPVVFREIEVMPDCKWERG